MTGATPLLGPDGQRRTRTDPVITEAWAAARRIADQWSTVRDAIGGSTGNGATRELVSSIDTLLCRDSIGRDDFDPDFPRIVAQRETVRRVCQALLPAWVQIAEITQLPFSHSAARCLRAFVDLLHGSTGGEV